MAQETSSGPDRQRFKDHAGPDDGSSNTNALPVRVVLQHDSRHAEALTIAKKPIRSHLFNRDSDLPQSANLIQRITSHTCGLSL